MSAGGDGRQWRTVLALASRCAREVVDTAGPPLDELTRATLARQLRTVKAEAFKPAGASSEDAASAFLTVTRAFARPETPAAVRRRLAPLVRDAAGFLDDALHELAAQAFERAHAGRPEVWG